MDHSVLEIEPLRDAFLARELEGRRFNKTQEDAWISNIARDVERDEHATAVAKDWLKQVLSSDKRDFCNFVPPLNGDTCKLFVQFFWLTKANDGSKAKKLLREARRMWGLEPRRFYAHSHGEYLGLGGDTAFSAPALLNRFLPLGGQASGFEVLAAPMPDRTSGVSTATKQFKLPAASRRKQNVSRPSPSMITKHQGAARTSFKKKGQSIPKARTTPRGLNSATNKNEGSEIVSDKGVDGAVGVTLDQREIRRVNEHMAARSSTSKARQSPHVGLTARHKRHQRFTNRGGGDGAQSSRPSQLPRRKRAANPRTKRESGALSPKVTSGATIALSDSRDQCSIAPSDRATDIASVPAPEPPSHSVSDPVTGRRRTRPMEADGYGSKKTRVARRSIQERRFSAPTELPARSSTKTHTISEFASPGATELDRSLAHIGAMAQEYHVRDLFTPVYSFDNATEDMPEDEEDPYGITMASEYPPTAYLGWEKGPEAAVFPKQLLPVTPPIWAESRQEVCESLDSFRSFQGGVYHVHDIAKGYLLGGHSSIRDIFHHGGRLIVSHGGGKAEALHSRNRCREVRGPGDQLEDDISVRALLNNYKGRRPLVLLADDNYRLFPFDLTAGGYTYVVLGFYWITHAWAELQQVNGDHGVVRYKFAFQWCEGQGDPWWPQDTESVFVTTQAESSRNLIHESRSTDLLYVGQADSQPLQPEMTTHRCLLCRMSSPLIYQDAPMCLQPRCPRFFEVGAGAPATGDSLLSGLSYSAELLRLRSPNHLPVSTASFSLPSPSDVGTRLRPFAKGMHCKACGRLSARFKWQHFQCSNSSCNRVYDVPHFQFSHKDFWLHEQTLKFFQHCIAEDSGIVVRNLGFQVTTNGSALPYIQTFDLPHDRGHIHLIPGHPSINNEANTLFGAYQKQASEGIIQFRRWPLRTHKCRGQLLSNYFSQNTGAPYQYIGGAERTTTLKEGAEPVRGALSLIRNRIETTLGKDIDFNEVLSAAYMEKQKMAFHSDSERGLGPVIASLSLGCVAEMHFRLHSKYTISEGPRKVAMSLILRHGDVLVMEGAGVQEYYEHAVVPKNFRIVATARSISPENYAT